MNSAYEALDTFAFETLALTAGAVGFTAGTMAPGSGEKSAIAAFCTVEGAPIRVRADGTNPTAAVGTPFDVGDTFVVWGWRDMKSVRFIKQGANAKVSTQFLRAVA